MGALGALSRAEAVLAGAPALRRAFAAMVRDHPGVLEVPEVVTLLAHLRVAGHVTTWSDANAEPLELTGHDAREQLALLSEIVLRIDAPRRSMELVPLPLLVREAWQAVMGEPFGDPYTMPFARNIEWAFASAIASAVHHYNVH